MRSDPKLRKWYKSLNKKWFNGRLPANTRVGYSESLIDQGVRRPTYGEMDWNGGLAPEIRINPLLREQGWIVIVAETLLHEMAHLSQFMKNPKSLDHGREWQGIMKSLAKRGAFGRANGILNGDLW